MVRTPAHPGRASAPVIQLPLAATEQAVRDHPSNAAGPHLVTPPAARPDDAA